MCTTRRISPRSRITPRVVFGELELHRRNPLIHLAGLDLSCYDRDYGPQAERDQARLVAAGSLAAGGGRRGRGARPDERAGGGRPPAGHQGLAAGIPPGTPTPSPKRPGRHMSGSSRPSPARPRPVIPTRPWAGRP
jgi:hypothetical protein